MSNCFDKILNKIYKKNNKQTNDMDKLFISCYKQYPNTWLQMKTIRKLVIKDRLFNDIDLFTHGGKISFSKQIRQMINKQLSNITLINQSKHSRVIKDKYMFTDEKIKQNKQKVITLKIILQDDDFL